MNGSALAFSFLSLVCALALALLLFGTTVGVSTNLLPQISLVVAVLPMVLLFCLNVAITIGLSKQRLWAFYSAGIELIVFMILLILNLWWNEFTSMMPSLIYLFLLISLLSLVLKDYLRQRASISDEVL